MNELVSIIIPVYNCREYLPRCLQSAASQTYEELEIILVDDGSTDGSSELCEDFAREDGRFRVVHIPNGGVSNARNTGLDMARGSYVTFMDADDYAQSGYVQHLLTELETAEADISCCGFVLHRPDSSVPVHGTGAHSIWNREQAMEQLVSGKILEPGVWGKLFGRALLDGIRFETHIKFNEDYLFNLRVFAKSARVVHRDLPLYNYVLHPGSATTAAPILRRAQDCIFVTEAAAGLNLEKPVSDLLLRKQCLGYLGTYNSLLYGEGEEIEEFKAALRRKILENRDFYKAEKLGKRNLFYYLGIKWCPNLYKPVYLLIKRLLPDRRTFRI